MLETQSSRGMDGIGLLYQVGWKPFIHKMFATKDYKNWLESSTSAPDPMTWFFTDERTYSFQKMEEWYQDIIENATKKLDQEKFVFAHHRKWTVGSNGLPNTHPFDGEKFILAQNGTDKRIHEWGIVEGIDPDRSDTFVLLQYLEMHCSTLEECVARLGILIQRKITIGTVMIYSKTEDKFLFFADGERSLYIEKNTDWTIDYIQSRKDDSTKDYKTKGYIVLDWEGQVYVEDITDLNKEKYVAPSTAAGTTYQGTQYYGTHYTAPYSSPKELPPSRWDQSRIHWGEEDWEDFIWEWRGFQDIIPDVEDVNAKEEVYDYVNYMPLADVMELLEDIDDKHFNALKEKGRNKTATAEEVEEYVNIIIYVGLLVNRARDLVEKQIKEVDKMRTSILDLGKAEVHSVERTKKIEELRYHMMEINSYKEIYKL